MLFFVLAASLANAATNVDIKSADGLVLKGSYYSPGKPGPGIVLFHQCDDTRRVWDHFAVVLAEAGIHVLTFDQRGYGESGGGHATPSNVAADDDAAFNWLASQPTVDRLKLAAGGGSCGVAQAANVAVMHRGLKALVLLSGTVASTASKYLGSTTSVAIFAATAEKDPSAGNVIATARASKSPLSIAAQVSGASHAARIFFAHPELETQIVKWLQSALR